MPEVPALTAEELKKKIDRGDDFILLDVRDASEVAICSLPGAVNIPLGQLPGSFGRLKEAPEVVVYCKYGGASARAARFLKGSGLPYVRNLTGGIDAWAQRVDKKMRRY